MIDKKLLGLLGENKKQIFRIVAIMVIALFGNLMITNGIVWAVKDMYDMVSNPAESVNIVPPFLLAIAGALIRAVCERVNGGLKDRLGRDVKKDLREKAFRKMTVLGAESTKDFGMAGLTQVAIEGIEQLDLYYSSYIPQFFYCMIAPVVLFLICLPICWQSAAVLMLMVPLIPVSIIAVSRYAKKIFAKYWGKYISMGGEFLDGVSGLETLKIFRADGVWHKKLNESSEEFRKITMKVLIMQLASTTIMDTVAYGGAAIGITAAVLSMNLWGLDPMKALFITLVAVDFFLPLRAFGSAFHVAMNGASAGQKLMTLLEMPEPEWGERKVSDSAEGHRIELKNVTFSYDGERDALKNVSAVFESGKLTAIAGKSGCGKSTMVGLLEGVLLPGNGKVTLDGVPVHDFARAEYNGILSVVRYNTYLFNTSIRENFQTAKPGITDEEIYAALRTARLDDFVRENGGLDRNLSEEGSNLSGGQRQRMALAICLARDTDIYIFDEAASNIDAESEEIIMGSIRELARSKTVILISHRLENVRGADRIDYMEDGEIRESGTHEELMANGAGYAEMYRAQKALEYSGKMEAAPENIHSDESGSCAAPAARPGTDKPGKARPWPLIVGKLLKLVGSLSGTIALAAVNGSVGAICALSVTLMGAVAVAKAMGAEIALPWGWIIAMTILFGVVRGALRFVEQYSNHYIAFKLLAVLRDKLFGALRKLCPAKLEGKKKGGIIAMITADIETLEVFYAHTISPVLIALVVSLTVFIFAGKTAGWGTGLTALMGYITVGVILPVIFQKLNRETGREYRQEFSDFNAYFLDSIRGVREIALYEAGEAREKEVRARSECMLASTKKMKTDASRASALTGLVVSGFILAALAVSMHAVFRGWMEPGYALMGAVAVFGSFGPVMALSALPANLTQTFASGDRVIDLMEEEPAVRDIADGEDFRFEDVATENVSFRYPDGEEPALCGVSMQAKKGEIVGIMGKSGCGKSTLLKLLLRFREADAGEILYNGEKIGEINTESLHKNVTMVQQETYLFNVSIRDNLLIAKPDATQEEIEEACRMASIHEFIQGLENGYDTEVGELGERLSAGEKQRIGLARAFLSGSELILLDEPTSNVDSINEGIILRALEKQKKKKSIILVSHRESTMAICDRAYTY